MQFSSDLDTSEQASYILKIVSKGTKGKQIEAERKFAVTTFFDEYGYLHRYKVKEAFDETL